MRPVAVVVAQTVAPLPVRLNLPVPNAIVLVFELDELKRPQVKVNVLSVIVPVVSVKVPAVVQSVGLPVRDKLMLTLLTVVLVETAVDATDTTPESEFASNVAVSRIVGAVAPAAPPLVADQLAVDRMSHVPAPPTQNLEAISLRLVLFDKGFRPFQFIVVGAFAVVNLPEQNGVDDFFCTPSFTMAAPAD